MDINLLKQLLIDQKKDFLAENKLIARDIEEKYEDLIESKQIIVATGVRRSGKSSFLKLLAKEILEKETDEKQFFYVNFDDEFFVNFDKNNFNDLLNAYWEIGETGKIVYCFFDEIQNVKYWEKWVNKLYEMGKFKIFVTGSNATLLSSEIATSLTGRNYPIEIFPFSFKEYLCYQNIGYPLEMSSGEKAVLKKEFDKYLVSGGFPESIGNRLDILDEYYKNIIYKDIIARYKIKQVESFRELSFFLLSNIASPATFRKLASLQAEKKLNLSSMTVKKFIGYLENSYLLFSVKKFEPSIKKQLVNPFKVYGIDNGLIQSVAFSISNNFNKLYENLVFLELRRRKGNQVYYFKNKFETDFIVKNKEKILLYQVSYNLSNPQTLEREKRGLLEAMDTLKQKEGIIINDYLEKEEKSDNKIISYVPLWKWLLN